MRPIFFLLSLLPVINQAQGWQLWAESLVGLGSDFGLGASLCSNGSGCVCSQMGDSGMLECATANLSALKALDVSRTDIDLPALIGRLHTPIQNEEGMKFYP